jgi:hypothetical protein
MSRLTACILVLSLSAATPAHARPVGVNQWEKTFDTPGRPSLVLRTDDADVHVSTWDRHAVGLRVTTRAGSIGDRGIAVDARQTGDRIDFEVREPHPTISFRWFSVHSVRIDVSVPRDADLDLTTGDGGVTLGAVAGAIRVRSGDGAIEADGLRGDLRLATSDGHIRALGLDGALEATSGDGSVEIAGRFDRLQVGTSDGRIVATALRGSRLAADWSLHSGDGSLTVRLPADLKSELYLHTGDGSIHLGLPVETFGRFDSHTLHGRLNGGGPLLELRTGDGPIRIEAD